MDRIDTSLLNSLTLTTPRGPVGPRAIDPSPRLRMVDRRDTVEIGGAVTASNPLVAGTVTEIKPTNAVSASAATNAAMRMYASPADQNAAATRMASNTTGATLDITA